MKVYIKEILLNNFFNYSDNSFKLLFNNNKSSYNIISGTNGSGKSVLAIESIYFNIFGKSIRSSRIEDIIKLGETHCSVSIIYRIYLNEKEYVDIKINRKLNNKIQNVALEILEINTNNNQLIEKLNYIKNITKLNIINDEIQKLFSINNKDFLRTFVHYPFSRDILNIDNCLKDPRLFEDIELLFEIGNISKKKMEEIDFEKNTILKYINNINKILNDFYVSSSIDLNNIKDKIDIMNENLKNIEIILNKNKNFKNKINNEILNLKSKINAINININNLKNKIKIIEELDHCPTCTRKINTEDKNNIINSISKEIRIMSNKRDGIYNNLLEVEKKLEAINRNIDELNNKNLKIIELKSKSMAILNNAKNIEKYQNDIKEMEQKLKYLDESLDDYKDIYNMFNKKSKYILSLYNNKLDKFINIFMKIYKSIISQDDIINFHIEENKMIILHNNIPYSLLSTSQKKKIELVYLITVLFIMANNIKNNSVLNFMILDEYFDNFDSNNTNLIINNLLKFNLNIQIILTTNFLIEDNIIYEDNKIVKNIIL